jgi:hypothetical protein
MKNIFEDQIDNLKRYSKTKLTKKEIFVDLTVILIY